MNLLFWKTCDHCKRLFRTKNMVHGIMIGPHEPWSFCFECDKQFFKKQTKEEADMPNYCNYSMKVTGDPEKINEFIEVIQRDDYESGRHFYRVFSAEIQEEETISEGFVMITGDCAWSVYSCMMEGESTYSLEEFKKYEEEKREIEKLKDSPDLAVRSNYLFSKEKLDKEMLASSLIRESKLLSLTIEVFSEEYGVGFQEHYVIKNGNVLVNECKDAREYDTDEYETVEAFNKEHKLDISKKEFEESDGQIVIGGFGDWEFDQHQEEVI